MIKKNKNIFTIIKFLISILAFMLIFQNSKKNFGLIIEKINIDFTIVFILILIKIIQHNVLSLRFFIFIKLSSKYASNFIEWSKLFFLTATVNLSPLFGVGHLMRSHEMKKKNFSYKEYMNLLIIFFFWGTLIDSTIILLTYLAVGPMDGQIETFIIFFYILIIFVCFILSINKSLSLIYRFFNKLNNYMFVNKFIFLSKLNQFILKSLNLLVSTVIKKNFLYFSLFTILTITIEFLMFNLILKNIFFITDIKSIIIFFILNHIIKRIPFLENILGLKETIMGFYLALSGFIFFEGVLFTLILRFLNVVSLILNLLIYYFFEISLFKNYKIKF